MRQRFVISGELIQNVAEHRYLGCMINEHVGSRVMAYSRARVGARALSAWSRMHMQGKYLAHMGQWKTKKRDRFCSLRG